MSDHIQRVKLDDYVEQMLPAAERRMVEDHVTTCPVCRARLAEAKQMTALLSDLPRENPAPNLAGRINAAVAARRAPRRAASFWARVVTPVAFALGLILLGMTASQWWGWVGSVATAQWPDIAIGAWLSDWLADPLIAWDGLMAFAEHVLIGSPEEMDALFTLAVVVLTLASVLGLARLLDGERPREFTPGVPV